LVRNKLLICKEYNIQPSELDRMAFYEYEQILEEINIIQKDEKTGVAKMSTITPISDFVTNETAVNSTFDICALLYLRHEQETFKDKTKVTCEFCDQSNYAIEVDFWNDDIKEAEKLNIGEIYILKNFVLKEFRTRTLTYTKASKIIKGNGSIEEFSIVNKYLAEHKSDQGVSLPDLKYVRDEYSVELTNSVQASPLYTIKDLSELLEGKDEGFEMKANIYGYIINIRHDEETYYYVSCENCKKKVDPDNPQCESCGKKSEHC